MANYGLPYMGSKNKIAEAIIRILPPADTFVDLFAGGCAITHAALLSGKYKRVIANDITDSVQLFKDAIDGKYRNETRWISRDDFKALKDSDPYVRTVWSFGNSQKEYLYSREIEPWKKALHYARVFGDRSLLAEFGIDSDGSRQDIQRHHDEYKLRYTQWYIRNVLRYNNIDDELLKAELTTKIKAQSEELRLYLCDALSGNFRLRICITECENSCR